MNSTIMTSVLIVANRRDARGQPNLIGRDDEKIANVGVDEWEGEDGSKMRRILANL